MSVMGLLLSALLHTTTSAQPLEPNAAQPAKWTDRLETLQEQVNHLESQLTDTQARLSEAETRLDQADQAQTQSQLSPPGFQGAGALSIEAGESVPEAVSFGGPLDIHGQVLGNAVSFGGDVRVHNGAYIQGDAVSFGGRVTVDEGGAVDGNRVTFGQGAPQSLFTGNAAGAGAADWFRSLARRLVVLLSFAGAGVMVVGLFPRQVDNVARTLTAHPVRSGFLGILLSGLAVLMASVLLITLVGIPVSLFIVVLVAIAWLLGFIGLCQAAGDLLPWSNRGARRWLAFLVGVSALTFIGSLPVIGWVVLALFSFVCVGAALQTRLGNREFVD